MYNLTRFTILAISSLLVFAGCKDNQDKNKTKPEVLTTEPPVSATALPTPSISSTIPVQVNLPPNPSSPESVRPWFDTFSWQSFIALNWPVNPAWPDDPTQRGIPQSPDDPSTFRAAKPGAVTVWGSYKEAYELFSQQGQRPSAWTSNDDPIGLCAHLGTSSKKMVMINKGGTVLDGLDEAFSFPLIDQNKNYAWTEVRYNQGEYDFIRGSDIEATQLYKQINLTNAQDASASGAIEMPESSPTKGVGAIMLKATWREMTTADDLSRYYNITASLYESEEKPCVEKQMGLVGFHIAQKLEQFPQWIWSSFEQVDNVELGPGADPSKTPISFNNGTDAPKTTDGFANRPEKKAPPLIEPKESRKPVQVTRFNPIPTTPPQNSTVDLNQEYQALLKGTVWANYQLVITQWPTNKNLLIKNKGGIYPQDSGQPFPVNGATNTVMETYFQSQNTAQSAGGNSCMSCHYGSAQSDYSWVLQLRANNTPATSSDGQ